jgi:hypothetical protein
MQIRNLPFSESITKLVFGAIVMMLLFLGFYSNSWHVAKQIEFDGFIIGADSLVIGRMLKSRQDGIFSAGGLTGAFIPYSIHEKWITGDDISKQFEAYLNKSRLNEYSPYLSQIGGQAMIFSLIDNFLPIPPQEKLSVDYFLTSLLSALSLTLIILWFYNEFGLLIAIFAASAMVLSPLLTLFGRSLWWSIWAFYLPMAAVMEFLKRCQVSTNNYFFKFGIVIFLSVFLKCFINGYEFITTTLIMMVTPLIYYGVRDKMTISQLLKSMFMAAIFSGLAIILSFTILSFQVGSLRGGNFINGIDHIAASFIKRTYGDANQYTGEYAASLKARAIDVVITYLKGNFISIKNYISITNPLLSRYGFKVRYMYLAVIFLLASVVAFVRNKNHSDEKQRYKAIALISATWFSILAPLSWYVIFKSHSFIHTSINNILWHMPFLLFGFAVCGLALKSFIHCPAHFMTARQSEG